MRPIDAVYQVKNPDYLVRSLTEAGFLVSNSIVGIIVSEGFKHNVVGRVKRGRKFWVGNSPRLHDFMACYKDTEIIDAEVVGRDLE